MSKELTLEQLAWVANLTAGQFKKLVQLLSTGEWKLVWSKSNHSYVLKPVSR